MIKDTFIFPVVGTVYSKGGVLMARLLHEGNFLKLVAEPDNVKDRNAIKVIAFGDEEIGYVPNRGMSCSNCWSAIKTDDQFCPQCNADWGSFIEGGLATRLTKLDILSKPHVCLVDSLDKISEFSIVKAKLIIE